MLDKVVDDWLTNIGEKEFEIPFAQLLFLRGYKVLHIACPHGPQEKGKDIIAIDPDGVPTAFQMKTGLLTMKNWRNPDQPLHGQVCDLLDCAIELASVNTRQRHRSVLVTTGLLDSTLESTIEAMNRARRGRRAGLLEVWRRDELKRDIISNINNFIPISIETTKEFLRLYIEDGRALPDKSKLSQFFERYISEAKPGNSKNRIQRICSEIVLLAGQLAHTYRLKNNHIGEIEVWTIACASIMASTANEKRFPKSIESSVELIHQAIWNALARLMAELKDRKNFQEGSGVDDWASYDARTTYALAYAGLATLWARKVGFGLIFDDQTRKLFKSFSEKCMAWGEGAAPYFLCIAWAWEQLGEVRSVENHALKWIRTILEYNYKPRSADPHIDSSQNHIGLYSPYVSTDEALEPQKPLERAKLMSCIDRSFVLESFIYLLVQLNMRQSLASLWPEITRIHLERFIPKHPADLWRYNNGINGHNESTQPPMPTSWRLLRESLSSPDSRIKPSFSDRYPHFLLLFLLVAPHRLNPTVAIGLNKERWEPL